jgi:hypothetical protein
MSGIELVAASLPAGKAAPPVAQARIDDVLVRQRASDSAIGVLILVSGLAMRYLSRS